jgi:hypothetical protein
LRKQRERRRKGFTTEDTEGRRGHREEKARKRKITQRYRGRREEKARKRKENAEIAEIAERRREEEHSQE